VVFHPCLLLHLELPFMLELPFIVQGY
jgi:hypothetical protein